RRLRARAADVSRHRVRVRPDRAGGRARCRGRNPRGGRMKTTGLRRLVDNTPLLAIEYTWRGQPRTVYAKSEQLNLSGSIKDRMALYILEEAQRDGRIEPGFTIVEATSGNTGISFAA